MTSEARFIVNMIVVPVGIILPFATTLLAWLKGGPAERWGASLFSASALGTLSFEFLTGTSTPVIEELFLDTAVAVGFLALAIRYNSLWLGAAMMVKGLQLAVHSTHLTDGEDPMFLGFNLYAAGLNLISLLICMILIGGTFATMGQRSKRRASERSAPAAGMPEHRNPTAAFGRG